MRRGTQVAGLGIGRVGSGVDVIGAGEELVLEQVIGFLVARRLFQNSPGSPLIGVVAGQVIEVPITGTQVVNKGDVLFKIDPTPYQFSVDQLKASIDQAESQKTHRRSLSPHRQSAIRFHPAITQSELLQSVRVPKP